MVINPSLVIGPAVNPYATSESFNMIKKIGNGSLKLGVPHYGFGVVDVRDVAEAHLRAAVLKGAPLTVIKQYIEQQGRPH